MEEMCTTLNAAIMISEFKYGCLINVCEKIVIFIHYTACHSLYFSKHYDLE